MKNDVKKCFGCGGDLVEVTSAVDKLRFWVCHNPSCHHSTDRDLPSVKEEKSYYRLGYEHFKDDKLISPDNFDKDAPVKAYQDYYRGALDAQIESAFYGLKTDFVSWSMKPETTPQDIVGMLTAIRLAFIMKGISKA